MPQDEGRWPWSRLIDAGEVNALRGEVTITPTSRAIPLSFEIATYKINEYSPGVQ